MSFKFKKTKDSQSDKLYLFVNYEGGDGDTKHPEYYEFKNIKFSEYQNHLEEIQSKIKDFKTLKKILDSSSGDVEYDYVKTEYGDKIARLFDDAPNDPQCDYQWKCYVDRIQLVGFDSEGNKFEAYV